MRSGCGRMHRGLRFFTATACSAVELCKQELVARDRAFVPPDAFDVRLDARSFTFEPISQLLVNPQWMMF
jgi:hypothetical protein